MFKKAFCLEKLHGTSQNISFDGDKTLRFFSGGASHELMLKQFDEEKLLKKFQELFNSKITVYGEGIGGCLCWRTPILLSNGKTEEIGKIVNHKLPVEVVTYNIKEQRLENKKVIGWSRQKNANNWNTIFVERRLRGGKANTLIITDNHIVFTKKNNQITETQCKDLKVGDTVFVPSFKLSYLQEDLIRGGILGDGSICISSSYAFKYSHSIKQKGYFEFKNTIMNSIKQSINPYVSGYGADCITFQTKSMPAIKDIYTELFTNNKKVITKEYLDKLNPLALATWYMDDGTLRVNNNGHHRNQCALCTNGYHEKYVDVMVDWFNSKGIEASKRKSKVNFVINFSPNGTERLHFIIAPYICESMKYKLNKEYRDVPMALDLKLIDTITTGLIESKINKIVKGNHCPQPCFHERFDIEVEDNNNFFANKTLVHNSMQGMSATYGQELMFVAFDVKIGDCWLNVPNAEDVVKKLGLGFVDYKLVTTTVKNLDFERDRESTQAIRNGMEKGKLREGIVLRPMMELIKNNGERVISKHKRDEFRETKTPRIVSDKELKIIEDADKIADEFVVAERLNHILDKLGCKPDVTKTGLVIKNMVDDIYREGKGEFIESPMVKKAISKKTSKLFMNYLKQSLKE